MSVWQWTQWKRPEEAPPAVCGSPDSTTHRSGIIHPGHTRRAFSPVGLYPMPLAPLPHATDNLSPAAMHLRGYYAAGGEDRAAIGSTRASSDRASSSSRSRNSRGIAAASCCLALAYWLR